MANRETIFIVGTLKVSTKKIYQTIKLQHAESKYITNTVT